MSFLELKLEGGCVRCTPTILKMMRLFSTREMKFTGIRMTLCKHLHIGNRVSGTLRTREEIEAIIGFLTKYLEILEKQETGKDWRDIE